MTSSLSSLFPRFQQYTELIRGIPYSDSSGLDEENLPYCNGTREYTRTRRSLLNRFKNSELDAGP